MNRNEAEYKKRQLEKQRDCKLKEARKQKDQRLNAIWEWYERELANIERETK